MRSALTLPDFTYLDALGLHQEVLRNPTIHKVSQQDDCRSMKRRLAERRSPSGLIYSCTLLSQRLDRFPKRSVTHDL